MKETAQVPLSEPTADLARSPSDYEPLFGTYSAEIKLELKANRRPPRLLLKNTMK